MALRSAPEQKSPAAPVKIAQRTSGSESMSCHASHIPTSISPDSALKYVSFYDKYLNEQGEET